MIVSIIPVFFASSGSNPKNGRMQMDLAQKDLENWDRSNQWHLPCLLRTKSRLDQTILVWSCAFHPVVRDRSPIWAPKHSMPVLRVEVGTRCQDFGRTNRLPEWRCRTTDRQLANADESAPLSKAAWHDGTPSTQQLRPIVTVDISHKHWAWNTPWQQINLGSSSYRCIHTKKKKKYWSWDKC